MNNTGARIKGKETKQLKQREHVLQCKYVISLHVDATQMKKYNYKITMICATLERGSTRNPVRID